MKKIIALILALLISFGCIVPAFADCESDNVSVDCRKEGELLSALGIFDENEISEDAVNAEMTRGNFAKKIALLLNVSVSSDNETYFYDTKDLPEANALAKLGIFKGDTNGYFYPNEKISENEAVIVLVRALGYEPYVAAKGGTSAAYVLTAKRLGLYSDFDNNGSVSVGEAVLILYNALLTNMYDIEAISNDNIEYTSKGDTLLYSVYETKCIDAAVTADRFTGFYSDADCTGDKQIALNGKVYNSTMKAPWEYIGQNVTAFVKDINGVDTVIYMAADEELNDTLVLGAGDFTYKNRVIKYDDENGKERKITMPSSAVVIKNHQAVTANYDKAFDIKSGTITLYKNAYVGNGYCVAVIDEPIMAVAQIIDYQSKIIYTADDDLKKIVYDETGASYVEAVTEPNGKKIGIPQLKRGDLLAVYRSENGNYTKIHLCAQFVEGMVDAVSGGKYGTLVQINGNKYYVSDAFVGTEDITAGMKGTFYLDVYGKIGYHTVDAANGSALYAYVYDARYDTSSLNDAYEVKLFDENGVHSVCAFADKVEFDGIKITPKQAYERLMDSSTGKLKRQMVMYRTNALGKIVYFDTAALSEQTKESDGTMWKAADLDSYVYLNDQHLFLPKYPILAGHTRIFAVPKETVESPNENLFAVMTFDGTTPFKIEYSYNVGFYKNISDTPYMDAVIYPIDEIPAFLPFKNVMLVNSVYSVSEKTSGETLVNMDCYISNYEYTVTVADKVNLTLADNTVITANAADIHNYISQGDLLNYQENVLGEIARISIIYDYDKNKASWGDTYSNYATASSRFPTDSMILAPVSDIYRNSASSSSQAMITFEYNGVDVEKFSVMPSRFTAIVFDDSKRDNKFYLGGLDDIVTSKNTSGDHASKVFIQRTSMYETTFVIYK